MKTLYHLSLSLFRSPFVRNLRVFIDTKDYPSSIDRELPSRMTALVSPGSITYVKEKGEIKCTRERKRELLRYDPRDV